MKRQAPEIIQYLSLAFAFFVGFCIVIGNNLEMLTLQSAKFYLCLTLAVFMLSDIILSLSSGVSAAKGIVIRREEHPRFFYLSVFSSFFFLLISIVAAIYFL
jgi:hypothetical protein